MKLATKLNQRIFSNLLASTCYLILNSPPPPLCLQPLTSNPLSPLMILGRLDKCHCEEDKRLVIPERTEPHNFTLE